MRLKFKYILIITERKNMTKRCTLCDITSSDALNINNSFSVDIPLSYNISWFIDPETKETLCGSCFESLLEQEFFFEEKDNTEVGQLHEKYIIADEK